MTKVVHYSVSSVPFMLDNADTIIELAHELENYRPLLCACAAILSAEALEQGIFTSLKLFSEWYCSHHGVKFEDTPSTSLMAGSLRQRILNAPKVLSEGEYELNMQSPYVEHLHDLITTRNELLHIKEDAVTIVEGIDREVIMLAEDHIAVIVKKEEPNPWGQIALTEAIKYRRAVGIYEEEINSQPMKLGELLVMSAT